MMAQDGFKIIPSAISSFAQDQPNTNPNPNSNPGLKRKRNLPGTPDPDAEVIALSPKSLMATNRFMCEICNKGFQRDQNLQLHRRGHNLPWKLKQRSNKEVVRKKVYICPEKTCVHHEPSRALGDLTGVKKHFSRKHGEKKWKCEKCSKKYAVKSDWKAHGKICGTREYKCDCGTLFSRKDSFITHRAFCDVLADESGARFNGIINHTSPQVVVGGDGGLVPQFSPVFRQEMACHDLDANNGQKPSSLPLWLGHHTNNNSHHVMNSMGGVVGHDSNNNPYLESSACAAASLFGLSSIQTPWLNKPTCTEEAFSGLNNGYNNSVALHMGLQQEEEDQEIKQQQLLGGSFESLTCLYKNNNNQSSQQQSSGHFSATALLQTAAQMGSTRNGGGDFGAIGSHDSRNNNPNMIRNDEIHKFFRQEDDHKQSEKNLDELLIDYISSTTSTTLNSTIGDGQIWDDNLNSSSSLMEAATKNNGDVHHGGVNGVGTSLTRDFLGVGDDGSRRSGPFFQQELANFASMGGSDPWA